MEARRVETRAAGLDSRQPDPAGGTPRLLSHLDPHASVGSGFLAKLVTLKAAISSSTPQQRDIDARVRALGLVVDRHPELDSVIPQRLVAVGCAFFDHANDGVRDVCAEIHLLTLSVWETGFNCPGFIVHHGFYYMG